jgi:capsular polysaccharide biosynthesis protein
MDIPFNQSSVVYLTRRGATNGGRNALNEADVITFLQNRYGTRVKVFEGGLSVQESIAMFSTAAIIIGTHGGAFYNINFAPKTAVVIEYVPVLHGGRDIASLPHAIFWAMANLLGQTYWRVPALSENVKHDVTIDLDKLTAILNKVDKQIHK